MSQISQEVPIDLGERSYRIAIGGGLLADAATYGDLPRASTALIVSNTTVAPLYASALRSALSGRYAQIHEIHLPDGEEHKNWQTLQSIFDVLLQQGCDRVWRAELTDQIDITDIDTEFERGSGDQHLEVAALEALQGVVAEGTE